MPLPISLLMEVTLKIVTLKKFVVTSTVMINWFLTRVPRVFNGERIICFTNGAETAEYSHAEVQSWTPFSQHI